MKEEIKLAAAFLLASNIVIGTLYLFLKCGGGSADRTALGTHASDSTALDKDTTEVKTPANFKGEEFTGEDEMYPGAEMIERMERRRANREDFDFDRRPPRGYRPRAPYPNDPMLNQRGRQIPNAPQQRSGQTPQRPGQPQQRPGQSQQRPGQSHQRSGQSQQRSVQTQPRRGQPTPQLGDRPSESHGGRPSGSLGDRPSESYTAPKTKPAGDGK